MRRKRNKAVQHEDTHRWMVSYADFITLLFAFFVVMYAISSVNVSKYKALSEGMNSAFNSKGVDRAPVQFSTNSKEGKALLEMKGSESEQFNALEKSLSELQDPDMNIHSDNGWVELDIKAGALFDSGSADLKPAGIVKLMKIAEIIRKVPYPIALEGYTDNVPINTPQFPSNWELSTARAAALARVLTIYGVDPGKITVTGYGEQYPVADNTTEDGRAKNRRVNLIIAKNKTVPRFLNPDLSSKKVESLDARNLNLSPGESHLQPIGKESQ
ncbi:flagellar motor protein MotB [Legionella rubrilucens]|nr:flagellar motor protein MotB [Legionella rubrilucens]